MYRKKEIYNVEIKAPGINHISCVEDEDDIAIIGLIINKIKRDSVRAAEGDKTGWVLISQTKPVWPMIGTPLEFWDSEKGRTVSLRETEVDTKDLPKELTHWRVMVGPPLEM